MRPRTRVAAGARSRLAPMPADTGTDAYAARLVGLQDRGWKRRLRRLDPYRWNIRRLCTGRTLDLGCGIGRCLAHLDGRGVGVDHNPEAVRVARSRGLRAVLPGELDEPPGSFDTLLVSHVLEHLDADAGAELLRAHLDWIRPGGRVVLITPQERGQASDPTHVRLVDAAAAHDLCARVGLVVERTSSFPFPRWAGRLWIYNETVVVARRP